MVVAMLVLLCILPSAATAAKHDEAAKWLKQLDRQVYWEYTAKYFGMDQAANSENVPVRGLFDLGSMLSSIIHPGNQPDESDPDPIGSLLQSLSGDDKPINSADLETLPRNVKFVTDGNARVLLASDSELSDVGKLLSTALVSGTDATDLGRGVCTATVNDFWTLATLNSETHAGGQPDPQKTQQAIQTMVNGMSKKPDIFVLWLAHGMSEGFVGVEVSNVLHADATFGQYFQQPPQAHALFEVLGTISISKQRWPDTGFWAVTAALVVSGVVGLRAFRAVDGHETSSPYRDVSTGIAGLTDSITQSGAP